MRPDDPVELDPEVLRDPVPAADAADRANRLVNDFLSSAAQSLTADEFKSLLDVAPGTRVVVARPEIVQDWTAGRLQGMMVTKPPRSS